MTDPENKKSAAADSHKKMPRRRFLQFSLRTVGAATGAACSILAGYKYYADKGTRNSIGRLTNWGAGEYILNLHQLEGDRRAKHIYISDDRIDVATMDNSCVTYAMPPGTQWLTVHFTGSKNIENKGEDGVEITLNACSIPKINLEEISLGILEPVPIHTGKTVIHLEGDVRSRVFTSAGLEGISAAEVRNVSQAFIKQTKYALTRAALQQAIDWREDEATGKNPWVRGIKPYSMNYTWQYDTEVKSGRFSMPMWIAEQDLTLVGPDGVEKLNVKEAFAKEKQKYLDSGKSAGELKALLEQHEKAAAKINPASGRERSK